MLIAAEVYSLEVLVKVKEYVLKIPISAMSISCFCCPIGEQCCLEKRTMDCAVDFSVTEVSRVDE